MSLLDAISKCFSESYDEARRKFLDAGEGLGLTPRFGLLKFDSPAQLFRVFKQKEFFKELL